MVAQDFNNLLSVILGYSQMMLADSAGDDPRRQALQEIYHSETLLGSGVAEQGGFRTAIEVPGGPMPMTGKIVPRDYPHPRISEQVDAVSGHYMLTDEKRLAVADGQVLYFTGYAVVDTACCGPGGCGYAVVAGKIIGHAYRRSADGRAVSRVVPIDDPGLQAEIGRRIMATDHVSQVLFDPS